MQEEALDLSGKLARATARLTRLGADYAESEARVAAREWELQWRGHGMRADKFPWRIVTVCHCLPCLSAPRPAAELRELNAKAQEVQALHARIDALSSELSSAQYVSAKLQAMLEAAGLDCSGVALLDASSIVSGGTGALAALGIGGSAEAGGDAPPHATRAVAAAPARTGPSGPYAFASGGAAGMDVDAAPSPVAAAASSAARAPGGVAAGGSGSGGRILDGLMDDEDDDGEDYVTGGSLFSPQASSSSSGRGGAASGRESIGGGASSSLLPPAAGGRPSVFGAGLKPRGSTAAAVAAGAAGVGPRLSLAPLRPSLGGANGGVTGRASLLPSGAAKLAAAVAPTTAGVGIAEGVGTRRATRRTAGM